MAYGPNEEHVTCVEVASTTSTSVMGIPLNGELLVDLGPKLAKVGLHLESSASDAATAYVVGWLSLYVEGGAVAATTIGG